MDVQAADPPPDESREPHAHPGHDEVFDEGPDLDAVLVEAGEDVTVAARVRLEGDDGPPATPAKGHEGRGEQAENGVDADEPRAPARAGRRGFSGPSQKGRKDGADSDRTQPHEASAGEGQGHGARRGLFQNHDAIEFGEGPDAEGVHHDVDEGQGLNSGEVAGGDGITPPTAAKGVSFAVFQRLGLRPLRGASAHAAGVAAVFDWGAESAAPIPGDAAATLAVGNTVLPGAEVRHALPG